MFQTVNFGNSGLVPDCFKTSLKGTFPASVGAPGVTFSTVGRVLTITGPITLSNGDFVYSETENQVRRIEKGSNNVYELDRPFASDVTNDPMNYIDGARPACRLIEITNTGGTTGVVNGMDIDASEPKLKWEHPTGVYPVAYDGTGTELMFVVGY